ncbi:Cytochrome oxidase assembly factor 4 [Smittium culicis]|uniref:Cytochrome oxidase assembly factor 4 n=1 Tax=Smittium culicis TaxID=133412 RepID=A0A1R1XDF4_9FUNG|nr:Cytochrome oxidase assembly factor 4 [Smittium culicis]
MNNSEKETAVENRSLPVEDEDEDEWDARIKKTGCYKENEALLICHFDTHDWRKCTSEMKAFKDCMNSYKNAGI